MGSHPATKLQRPGDLTRWESRAARRWHSGLSIASLAIGGFAIFFPPSGNFWWVRIVLVIIVVACGVMALFIKHKSDGAKEGRLAQYKDARDDTVKNFASSMAILFDSLSHSLRNGISSNVTESFLSKCAERALELVGNENNVLRACIYKYEGREDYESPKDDHLLQLVDGTRHGRLDWPRTEFKYSDEEGRDVIDELMHGQPVKYDNLSERAPRYYKPSKKNYVAFYSVPVMERGQLRGMVSCDSSELDVLGKKHEVVLQMLASIVGIGFRLMSQAARVEPPDIKNMQRGSEDERISVGRG